MLCPRSASITVNAYFIKFLAELFNIQTNLTDLLASKIKQDVGQGLTTPFPRRLGQRTKSRQKEFSAMRVDPEWNERTAFAFFQELEESNSAHLSDVVRSILRWADSEKLYIDPERDNTRAFTLVLMHREKSYPLFSVQSSGLCGIYFQYINKSPFDAVEKRMELLSQLNSIEGMSISMGAIHGRSEISLSVLKNEVAIKRFLEIFTWLVEEIKES
jgi:hypothetical protein